MILRIKETDLPGCLKPKIPFFSARMLFGLSAIAIECRKTLDFPLVESYRTLVQHFERSSLLSLRSAVEE
jgi:hypothetical protein